MRDFLIHFPWPLYPGILAWCVGFIIQIMMTKEVDHQKIAQLKLTFGPRLQGCAGTSFLTERGLRLHRWFLVSAAIFVASVLLTAILHWKH